MLNVNGKACAAISLGVACFVFGRLSAADEIVFPNADGSGDLTSKAAWALDEIPYASNVLIKASGTYTFLNDAAFAGFRATNNSINIVFDVSPDVSGATPDASRTIEPGAFDLGVNKRRNDSLTLKGGVWDFKNQGKISLYSGYGYTNHAYFIDATLTNLPHFKGGYGANGNVVTFDHCRVHGKNFELDGYQCKNNFFEIKGGSYVDLMATNANGIGFVLARAGANSGGNNTLRVSGEGTKLFIGGPEKVSMPAGDVATGNVFHVTHGASVVITNADYLFIGGQTNGIHSGISSRWRIEKGAHLMTKTGTIQVGINGGYARLELFSGATWTNLSWLSIGADYQCAGHNQFIISNATYVGRLPILGRDSNLSTNNLFHVTGRDTVFDITAYYQNSTNTHIMILFPRAHRQEMVFSDGVVWTNMVPSTVVFSSQQTSCWNRVTFRDGAEYYGTNKFHLASASYNVRSNTLVVASGARFTSHELSTSSIGNGIICSNAYIETKDFLSYAVASSSTWMHGISNCWMRIQGESPRIKVGSYFKVYNNSSLHFDLPHTPYADAPVTCAQTFTVARGSDLFVNGIEAYACAARRPHRVTLVEAAGGVSLDAEVLAAANAHLDATAERAAGSRLMLSADGKKLVLRVAYPNGTHVLVR